MYLCRLVAELNTLFSVGIQVFDASRDCIITVRVLVLVFILDNRALHDVSGIQDAGGWCGEGGVAGGGAKACGCWDYPLQPGVLHPSYPPSPGSFCPTLTLHATPPARPLRF